jgi:hypothetical protein
VSARNNGSLTAFAALVEVDNRLFGRISRDSDDIVIATTVTTALERSCFAHLGIGGRETHCSGILKKKP